MPRFFMNIQRGKVLIPDKEGDDLPDAEAARALALDTVQEMKELPHIYGDYREWQRHEFVITDEGGNQVLTVPWMLADHSTD